MWPCGWQKSHPVTGPRLNCLRQEYADWDIHPPAIVPLLISSHRTLFFNLSFSQKWSERTSRFNLQTLKRKGSSWRMEMKAAANDNCPRAQQQLQMACFVSTNTQSLSADNAKGTKNHLREAGTEIWHFYIKYSAACQSSLIDSSFHLSLVVTCGRDL